MKGQNQSMSCNQNEDNISSREFKVMVIWILMRLEKRVDNLCETHNKQKTNKQKNQR